MAKEQGTVKLNRNLELSQQVVWEEQVLFAPAKRSYKYINT